MSLLPYPVGCADCELLTHPVIGVDLDMDTPVNMSDLDTWICGAGLLNFAKKNCKRKRGTMQKVFVIKHGSGFYYHQGAERMVDCFSVISSSDATVFETREQARVFIDEKLQEFLPYFLSIEEITGRAKSEVHDGD